jgi:hypothetical protein
LLYCDAGGEPFRFINFAHVDIHFEIDIEIGVHAFPRGLTSRRSTRELRPWPATKRKDDLYDRLWLLKNVHRRPHKETHS